MQSFHLLLTVCQAAAACAVTVHVLLTKRDTAASIGWIGVAFLLPGFGVVLYLMFGINRVRRLARKLVRQRGQMRSLSAVHAGCATEGRFAPLASMVGKLTERPLLGGNSVEILQDGDAAYPAMLAAIASARSSLLLSSYIFRYDAIGRKFVAALAAAHQRGVAVRVLVDGVGTGYFSSPTVRHLRAAHVPCEQFLHSLLPWRMPFINLRNHKKILVADGREGFLGGINIGAENQLSLHPRHPVSDMHFRLCGPIVHQLTEAFAWDWSFTCGEELEGTDWFPDLSDAGNHVLRVVTAGPDTDLEKIEYTMLQAITLARSRICVMTPYFLPGTRVMTELSLAALRGVSVEIVIPQASNHVVMDWACRADIHPVLDAGCKVWLAAPPFNHSKLFVVDRQWAFIGSSNLDMRSLRLNFEINVESYGEDLAGSIEDFVMSHRRRRLTHHDLDNRSAPVKLRDAAARLLSPYL